MLRPSKLRRAPEMWLSASYPSWHRVGWQGLAHLGIDNAALERLGLDHQAMNERNILKPLSQNGDVSNVVIPIYIPIINYPHETTLDQSDDLLVYYWLYMALPH